MLFTSLSEPDPFFQLRHQAVRDLAWCCLSAPLLQTLPDSEAHILPLTDHKIWPWLLALDRDPTALLKEIAACKSTRLGIYYETLWRFYFSQSPEWQLLAYNLPVNRGKATLGAFDFLCQRGDEFWHIETAVKFYLCATRNPQQADNWNQWIGPNSNDRFDLKLGRLRDHQLPLHQTLEGSLALQKRYPKVQHWKSGLCLQGYLFSPAPTEVSLCTLTLPGSTSFLMRPSCSHKHQGVGFWWYLRDFLRVITMPNKNTADTEWVILERNQWFSPVQLNDANLTTDIQRSNQQVLLQQLHKTQRPLMIAAVKKYQSGSNNTDNIWREQFRGFVVPDNWPVSQE